MDQESFLKGQVKVYEKFINNEQLIKRGGISLDPALEREIGAHVIVGLYGQEALLQVENLSSKIAETVPAIIYGPKNAHLTIVAMTEENFHKPNNAILQKLRVATEKVLEISKRYGSCPIQFRYPIFNQACTLLEGMPKNEDFLELTKAIITSCLNEEVAAKLPWGFHTTISRFTKITPASDLARFFDLIEGFRKESPIETHIEAIGVGWCTASTKNGFHLFIEKRFGLSANS